MNLNDLIEEKGEDFVNTEELLLTNLDNPIDNLEGIERFKSLNKLHARLTKNNYSLLENINLQEVIKEIYLLCYVNLIDIAFLRNYKKLEKIFINDSLTSIKNFVHLNAESLTKTVKEIDIWGNEDLIDLSFLKDYQNLERISFIGCANISNYSSLYSRLLKKKYKSDIFRKWFFRQYILFRWLSKTRKNRFKIGRRY